MRPLYASILATTTALKTCKVQDLATRRISGALLAPFGGRAGAAHELVAVRGVDETGEPIAGLCDAATIGATVPLTVSVPKPLAPLCILTTIECAAALATEGLKATPETITLLGATPEFAIKPLEADFEGEGINWHPPHAAHGRVQFPSGLHWSNASAKWLQLSWGYRDRDTMLSQLRLSHVLARVRPIIPTSNG